MREFKIGEAEEGQKLMNYTKRLLPGAPEPFLYQMFRKKYIELNGRKAAGKEILKTGDTVRYFFSGETWDKFSSKGGKKAAPETKTDPALLREFKKRILFENDGVLILNKKAGWLSQSDGSPDISVNDLLLIYTEKLRANSTVKPSVSNRLDRNTSGIMLCGKTAAALKELSELMRSRSLKKFYDCIVVGERVPEGEIKGYLKKDQKKNTAEFRENPFAGADEVGTVFKKKGRIEAKGIKLTLLEAELLTGKPHQIRSVLLYYKTPIIGDPKYFTDSSAEASRALGLNRQLLHSSRILFPKLKGTLGSLSEKKFEAPLPEDMLRLCKYRVS
ncbi:MAG: RluA family pseudouridine synthase [Lachnospiraceae bacterium]|nr:RluA family pseudouridine synthase [Lachnospiraceae bacterium]